MSEKIKLKELPSATSIHDDDIFVESDSLNTYKVTANDVAKYVSANPNVTELFAALEQNLDDHLADEDAHGYNTKINSEISRAINAEAGALADAKSYTDTKLSELALSTGSSSSVSFTPSLTSGTAVGTLTIDGSDTTLYCQTNTDTKNTAGSTNSSSKLFLIGATSQTNNPQTYSHDTAYVGTDGCLYSNNTKVSVDGHTHTKIGTATVGSPSKPIYLNAGTPTPCTSIGTELTATLAAGDTSVTFTNASITADSTIDVYTNIYGVNPTAMTIDAGTNALTITFNAQDADVQVKVRVM